MSESPVVILLTATLREGTESEVRALLAEILPVSLAYDGCLGISHHFKQDGSRGFLMIERWQSFNHYRRYVEWRDSTGDLDRLKVCLEGPPALDVWPLDL